MPLPLLRKALEAWPDTDFIQAYGLTEVGGVISLLAPEDHRSDNEERMGSAGRVVPGAEVRVVDPDSLEDVASGQAGRIVVPHKAVDEGLSQQARRDRGGDHRGRLVPHR